MAQKLTGNRPLLIRNVDAEIIRKIKIYAASNDISMADTLKRLVDKALAGTPAE